MPAIKTRPNGRSHRIRGHWHAFTLIELLVVVAIISLLISILLPSLSQARAQARSAVCASRLGQLGKSMLMYSEDYNETPPFMGLGWSNLPELDAQTEQAPGDISRMTDKEWAVAEDWLSPNFDQMWNAIEEDWPDRAGPRYGSLFGYTRFEKLYRCPDFERIANKSQNQFNYTRTILGRKWILGGAFGRLANRGVDEPGYWGGSDFGAPGPIMKVSQIHAPANMNMLIDEWWLRHVGSDPSEHIPYGRSSDISGGWAATDCMFFPFADEYGRYHGAVTPGVSSGDTSTVKRANTAFYDGHVALEREILPNKSDMSIGTFLVSNGADFIKWLSGHIFAQRGRALVQ